MAARYTVSRELYAKVKLANERQYIIGQRAGLQPAQLTSLLRGYAGIERGDPRVVRLALAVGLDPSRAFSRRRLPARP
jgi:hypothetical protein